MDIHLGPFSLSDSDTAHKKRHSRSLLNYNILVLCLQTKSVDPLLFLCLKFLICMLSSQCKLKMFSLVLLFDLIISDTLVA